MGSDTDDIRSNALLSCVTLNTNEGEKNECAKSIKETFANDELEAYEAKEQEMKTTALMEVAKNCDSDDCDTKRENIAKSLGITEEDLKTSIKFGCGKAGSNLYKTCIKNSKEG